MEMVHCSVKEDKMEKEVTDLTKDIERLQRQEQIDKMMSAPTSTPLTGKPGVKDEQVIGRLDGFYRGEKYHTVRDLSYKIYVAVWCLSPRIRKPLMKIVGYLENKKLKKQKGKKDEKM